MSIDKLLPPEEAIEQLLTGMTRFEASDLHLKVHFPPYYRVGGHLRKLEMPDIPDNKYMEAMLTTLIPPNRRHVYDEVGSIDFSAQGSLGDRFRINVFKATGEMHAAIRRVNSKIPDFDEDLHLPEVYRKTISQTLDGLILVTGVTGSGKSSTLAAMVDYINTHRSLHIVTIEDPIEYSFTAKKSIISQREIGIDVNSFPEALRYVVREDPDCILIGEMRDRETILAALQAAETGHLVLGTLHVGDVQQSFNRILEFYPRNEHAFIRSSLANSLRTIMCQRLLPGIEEGLRFPATEVLINSAIVKDKIRNEEDDDIPAIIEQCVEEGMRSFTFSLNEMIEAELIYYDTAMDYAPNREALASAVKGIKTSAQSLVGRIRARPSH